MLGKLTIFALINSIEMTLLLPAIVILAVGFGLLSVRVIFLKDGRMSRGHSCRAEFSEKNKSH